MKSFTTMLALPALFIGAFAAPAVSPEKRQVTQVVSTVQGLIEEVTTITSKLNVTVESYTSVESVPNSVVVTVQTELKSLAELIEKTTTITSGLPIVGTVATGVVGEVVDVAACLITEIVATLGNVEKVVPLELITTEVTSVTSVLGGLLTTIAKLLDIGNLIQLVTGLVGGVLPLTSVTSILGGTTSVTYLLGGL
ncbi:Hypothetical predicted protein [Lecanosticta acicola]|uniref:Uncharacterized protein n=1 Tax=Lecanosticta acicola TaxID=111012 RepID=A0AAI8W101_9PEZI|nr:Hypothetical predicted protein [Lecanosticta acicola]